ncbi:hypothetical protein Syun_028197 [Stephania yunnanensis]|uniref:Uncharacterized protein n=1 Tax=Stephania yunnanensis TaxID=152371 RepID=A0AAP0HQW9_9MAGN
MARSGGRRRHSEAVGSGYESGGGSGGREDVAILALMLEARVIESFYLMTDDQVRHKLFSLDPSGKKAGRILDSSGSDQIICKGHCNFIYLVFPYKDSDLLAKR